MKFYVEFQSLTACFSWEVFDVLMLQIANFNCSRRYRPACTYIFQRIHGTLEFICKENKWNFQNWRNDMMRPIFLPFLDLVVPVHSVGGRIANNCLAQQLLMYLEIRFEHSPNNRTLLLRVKKDPSCQRPLFFGGRDGECLDFGSRDSWFKTLYSQPKKVILSTWSCEPSRAQVN